MKIYCDDDIIYSLYNDYIMVILEYNNLHKKN